MAIGMPVDSASVNQVVLQAEPVDLHVRENDRPARGREQLARFVECLSQRIRIGGRKALRARCGPTCFAWTWSRGSSR